MEKPTDSEIIDRLGGTTEVARICQIKPPSVSEWRATGIPSARRQYLALLRPDAFGIEGSGDRTVIGPLVDSRMSKRALRSKFGFKTDAHLAKVLKLPLAEVEAWPEEKGVPPLPQVLHLLGVAEQVAPTSVPPDDPDADRIDLGVHAA
ncbi:hypothetical protein D3C87_1633910 [compost metagenome]